MAYLSVLSKGNHNNLILALAKHLAYFCISYMRKHILFCLETNSDKDKNKYFAVHFTVLVIKGAGVVAWIVYLLLIIIIYYCGNHTEAASRFDNKEPTFPMTVAYIDKPRNRRMRENIDSSFVSVLQKQKVRKERRTIERNLEKHCL